MYIFHGSTIVRICIFKHFCRILIAAEAFCLDLAVRFLPEWSLTLRQLASPRRLQSLDSWSWMYVPPLEASHDTPDIVTCDIVFFSAFLLSEHFSQQATLARAIHWTMVSAGASDYDSAATHILCFESAIAHLQQHVLPSLSPSASSSSSAAAHTAELQRALTAAQLAVQTWRAAEAIIMASVHHPSAAMPSPSVLSATAAATSTVPTTASSSSSSSSSTSSTTAAVSRQYDAFPIPASRSGRRCEW